MNEGTHARLSGATVQQQRFVRSFVRSLLLPSFSLSLSLFRSFVRSSVRWQCRGVVRSFVRSFVVFRPLPSSYLVKSERWSVGELERWSRSLRGHGDDGECCSSVELGVSCGILGEK